MYLSIVGHQSFIADLQFLSDSTTHFLVSIGWDGQVLFWQDIWKESSQHLQDKQLQNLPYVETEPQWGFKLGPSASIQFIPLTMRALLGCGLLVVLVNKLGHITIVSYMTS